MSNHNVEIPDISSLTKKNNTSTWIIGILVILLISAIFLPPMLAKMYLANNITSFINTEVKPTVTLKANTFQLMSGKFKSLNIAGDNLTIGNLTVSSYKLNVSEGKIDVLKSIKEKDMYFIDKPVVSLTLNINKQGIISLLSRYYSSLSDMKVEMQEGYLDISGVTGTQKELNIPIKFKLKLKSDDWDNIKLVPYDIEATGGQIIDDDMSNNLTKIYSKTVLFKNTSPSIYINSVTISNNNIEILTSSTIK